MNGRIAFLAAGIVALWPLAAARADALPITAGLVLQLDASDVDGDGATDVLGAPAPVATWADKSPNGHDVTNGGAAAQPNQVPGVLNGLPVVRFTGTEWLFRNDALGFTGNPAATVFAVTVNMPDVGANDSRILQFGADGVGENTQFQTYAFAIESSWRYNNGNRVFANDPLDLPTANIGVWLSPPGTNYGQKEFYRNGTTAAVQTGVTNGGNVSNLLDEGLGVGGAWVPNSGHVGSPSRFLVGELAEVLIYDSALTLDEINQVGYYLQTKWAVADGTFTPEPATLALLALGAVPALRRRRR